MQNSPVLSVLVKGLFPPGPAASGRSGAAAGGACPLPHLENRISVQKCQEKTPPETHPPAPRGIEKSPCHSGTGALVAGVNGKASNSSLYFAGTQAAGAGVDTAGSTVYNCLYPSDIGLPGTVRPTMGVRNLDPESNALTTNFAFCHLSAPPYGAILSCNISILSKFAPKSKNFFA